MAKQTLFYPRKFILWFIFFVIITGFSGLVYGSVQQVFRQGANDPQIQMAEDTAANLNSGQPVQMDVPTHKVDVAKSLASFVIIYDKDGKVTSSSVQLNGQTPPLPDGVLTAVKDDGEKRFTWQPQDDVRIAAVVTSYNDGYVLAGRSLREVEIRENKLTLQVAGVWIAAVGIVTVLSFLL